MKVYRIVPDSFTHNELYNDESDILGNDKVAYEDIYYNMGYISFSEQPFHKANTIWRTFTSEEWDKQGKYFFWFPEDACRLGFELVWTCRGLYFSNYRLLEYDIPFDVLLKHKGVGLYGDCPEIDAAESYVIEDDLGKVISSKSISTESKNKSLLELFKHTLKTINHIDRKSFDSDITSVYSYDELFGVKDLNEVIEDEKRLKEVLFNSKYYESFINKQVSLIKANCITNKMITDNVSSVYNVFHETERKDEFLEYYKNNGIILDYSEDKEDLRYDFCIESNKKGLERLLRKIR